MGLLGLILAGPREKAMMKVKHGKEAGLGWKERWELESEHCPRP